MLRRPCFSSYCGLVRETNGVFRPCSPNPFSFFFFPLQALPGNCLVYQHYCSRYNSLQCAMTHYCTQQDIRLIHTKTMGKISPQSSQCLNTDRLNHFTQGAKWICALIGWFHDPSPGGSTFSNKFLIPTSYSRFPRYSLALIKPLSHNTRPNWQEVTSGSVFYSIKLTECNVPSPSVIQVLTPPDPDPMAGVV